MENRAHALAAGIFVVAVTALVIAMTLWLTRDIANTITYEMVSHEAVTGLQVQAPVRFKGVLVGKVTAIGFDPAHRSDVLITLAIDNNAPVTRSTFGTLAFQGVTGLSYVQLDGNGSSVEPPAAGSDGVPRIPLHPNALGQLTDQVGALVGKVDQAADSINRLLGPENQAALKHTLTEVGLAAQSTHQLAQTVNRTLTAQFGPAKTSIPALVRQANATLKATETAARNASHAMTELDGTLVATKAGLARIVAPGGVLDRLDESTRIITHRTLPGIERFTTDATHTADRLSHLTDTLNDNPQVLLYGNGPIAPGPGEPGFVAPRAAAISTPSQAGR